MAAANQVLRIVEIEHARNATMISDRVQALAKAILTDNARAIQTTLRAVKSVDLNKAKSYLTQTNRGTPLLVLAAGRKTTDSLTALLDIIPEPERIAFLTENFFKPEERNPIHETLECDSPNCFNYLRTLLGKDFPRLLMQGNDYFSGLFLDRTNIRTVSITVSREDFVESTPNTNTLFFFDALLELLDPKVARRMILEGSDNLEQASTHPSAEVLQRFLSLFTPGVLSARIMEIKNPRTEYRYSIFSTAARSSMAHLEALLPHVNREGLVAHIELVLPTICADAPFDSLQYLFKEVGTGLRDLFDAGIEEQLASNKKLTDEERTTLKRIAVDSASPTPFWTLADVMDANSDAAKEFAKLSGLPVPDDELTSSNPSI